MNMSPSGVLLVGASVALAYVVVRCGVGLVATRWWIAQYESLDKDKCIPTDVIDVQYQHKPWYVRLDAWCERKGV